ncbi:DUF4112 domain-containing protein [Chondromyces crocatus]|uniref:DUF4112 domain-containing protein n=1 Tax=Chondromyces crocatus TaxID=52 RepID=A0A0K1ERT1_CHOCO|nr:DUF4112 domain-containing protein [Chondromyces crocatus]AKT43625.1 uncharacterized protein CMC5_078600 [Chondromyces crocatus]
METAAVLVKWLDRRFLDPLIGLAVPAVGDILTSVAGLYLVVLGVRRKVPAVIVARMLVNLGLDALLGAVPVLGDVFDFAFRANVRNLALLEMHHEGRPPRAKDWLVVGGAALFLLVALAVPIALAGWLIAWLFGGHGGG